MVDGGWNPGSPGSGLGLSHCLSKRAGRWARGSSVCRLGKDQPRPPLLLFYPLVIAFLVCGSNQVTTALTSGESSRGQGQERVHGQAAGSSRAAAGWMPSSLTGQLATGSTGQGKFILSRGVRSTIGGGTGGSVKDPFPMPVTTASLAPP